MDADRFDTWTRSLTVTAASRRRVLASGAGCTLAMLAGALGVPQIATASCRDRQARCASKHECCGSKHGKTTCGPLTNAEVCRSGRRCCAKFGTKCTETCDCCGTLFCGSGGTCET